MSLTEASDTYIPQGYITEDLTDKLLSVQKYASIGLFTKNGGVKTDREYEVMLIALWDEMDKHPVPALENVIVELEGRIVGLTEDMELQREEITAEEWEYYKTHKENLTPDLEVYHSLLTERAELKALKTQITDYLNARLDTGEIQA